MTTQETPSRRPPIKVIAPSTYIQGPGLLEDLHCYLTDLGTRATVICTASCWDRVGEQIAHGAEAGNIALHPFYFSGESSLSQIEAGAAAACATHSDIVIGLGGGKAIDTAKSVARRASARTVIVPTIASTDAPTSAASVVYTDAGDVELYEFHPRNPDLVLVDETVVVHAPARFLVSGMADAVSTRWEGMAAAAAGSVAVSGGRPSNTALTLGAIAWDNCKQYGLSAMRAVEAHAITPAVEIIIETNTYHSGIGFESGGFSGAHSVHNGLTELPETHAMMHGEKVSFGVLTQLVLEGRPDKELDEYIDFAVPLGLPVTLSDLGLTHMTEAQLHQVAQRAVVPGESIHWMPFPVTAEMVAGAIVGADAYARAYRKAHPHLRPPYA